jgi:hypothetical protein
MKNGHGVVDLLNDGPRNFLGVAPDLRSLLAFGTRMESMTKNVIFNQKTHISRKKSFITGFCQIYKRFNKKSLV